MSMTMDYVNAEVRHYQKLTGAMYPTSESVELCFSANTEIHIVSCVGHLFTDSSLQVFKGVTFSKLNLHPINSNAIIDTRNAMQHETQSDNQHLLILGNATDPVALQFLKELIFLHPTINKPLIQFFCIMRQLSLEML
jgi:hypothetical protein